MVAETQALDAQIAARLFGWAEGQPCPGLIEVGDYAPYCEACGRDFLWHEYDEDGGEWSHPVPLRPYSSDIAAAFEVVKAMRERGWDVQISSYQGAPWECVLEQVSSHYFHVANADDPAEAICRAALEALDAEGN